MSEWVPRDGILRVGTQMGALKLAMASTYIGLVALVSSIVKILILYS